MLNCEQSVCMGLKGSKQTGVGRGEGEEQIYALSPFGLAGGIILVMDSYVFGMINNVT